MSTTHLSESDLERYVTGMVHLDAEVAWIEQHLFSCPACVDRMETMQDDIDDRDAGLRRASEELEEPGNH